MTFPWHANAAKALATNRGPVHDGGPNEAGPMKQEQFLDVVPVEEVVYFRFTGRELI